MTLQEQAANRAAWYAGNPRDFETGYLKACEDIKNKIIDLEINLDVKAEGFGKLLVGK